MKRLLLLLLASSLLPMAGCGSDPAPKDVSTGPNVVLVLIDALRRDHLNSYGYAPPTSPRMELLGREGVVFDQAYSHASQTFYSTSSMLASRIFPLQGGVRGPEHKQKSIAKANLMLPEVLREHAYDTLGVFTNPHHYSNSGFWQGFDEPIYLEAPRGELYAGASEVTDRFAAWLDGRASERAFLAYLHFMDVHDPYRPPPAYAKIFDAPPWRFGLYRNGKPPPERAPDAKQLVSMQARYDAEIRYVDAEVGRIVKALERHGEWQDTLFIVTSDHGDEFMEHGGLGHGMTLEKEMVWMPLIFGGGAVAAARQRVGDLVRHIDIAPTVLDAAGIPIPDEFEGRSLLPVLAGDEPPRDVHSFAWLGSHRSISTRRWHFVWNQEAKQGRLYDNDADPAGLSDVAAQHTTVVAEMRALVDAYEQELEGMLRVSEQLEASADPEGDEIDPKILEQLRGLGYVE